MKTIHCIVCHKEIGLSGWPSHVAMEKRKYGKNIYKLIRGGYVRNLDLFRGEEDGEING